MSLRSVKILGISITISAKKEILKYIDKSLGKSLTIVTPNPEQIVYAQRDSQFAKILNKADIAIPDGIGVAWVLGIERIAGVEFMEDLVGIAAKQGIPVALIGGRGDLAVKTFECLSRRTPGLKGWGEELGEIGNLGNLGNLGDLKNIVQKIQKTGVRIVFVGLGAPKQEYFIARLARQSPAIYMSVGGSFDIITGRTPRAPQLLRTFGLEWLWRLFREPWRMKRQLALLQFMWLVTRERFITR